MNNVFCLSCGWEGEESELTQVTRHETSEFWGMRETQRTRVDCCPDCGSGDVDDVIVDATDDE